MGLQEDLIAALDADRVVTGADELRRHGTDEGWHTPAAPDFVVYPRDTEEAAAVVRACCKHHDADRPVRRRHLLEGHVAALTAACRVDMSQANQILRLSVEDMDVTVQAGVTRRQLDEKLRPEGVFFSVDPGADATIGGMVATGASGTTSVRYGTMRENVLSLTVVTADGEIVRTKLARPQVERRLRPHPPVHRLRGHARADRRGHAARPADARGDDRRRVRVPDARRRRRHRDRGARPRDPGRPHRAARRRADRRRQPPLRARPRRSPRRSCSSSTARPNETAAQAQGRRGDRRTSTASLGFDWAADETERRALWHARHGAYESARALRPGSQGFTTDACVPISNLAALHQGDQGRPRRVRACSRRSSATSATATSTSRSSSTPTTPTSCSARRTSTTGSSAARSPTTAPARASTASATASPRSWSSSTARTCWR